MMKNGIETNQINGGNEMTTTTGIESKTEAKIAAIVDRYYQLQDMMACRQVSYAMENCEYELQLLTGLSKFEIVDKYTIER